jgi:Ca2+/H+ antiporter
MLRFLIFPAIPVVVYLLFVFVSLEWNILAWDAQGRFLFALLSIAGCGALAIAAFGEEP